MSGGGNNTQQPPAQNGFMSGLRDFTSDRDKMAMILAALSSGLAGMSHRPNTGLQQVGNALLSKSMDNVEHNKSMAFLAEKNPELHAKLMELPKGVRDQYMGVVFENMLKPKETFTPASPEQLKKFGIAVDENGMPTDGRAYQVSSTTGELSSVGGGGQNIQITNEADRDDAWLTHLVDMDKAADTGIRERGANAFDSLYNLTNLQTQLAKLESTGEWEKTQADFMRIASKFGVEVNEEFLGDFQSAEAAANALVADELRKNKGPQTDFDAQFAASYTATPDKLGSTNQDIINHRKGIATRDQFISNLYQNELATLDRDDATGQRAAARKWNDASRNVPTVIPREALPEGDEVRNSYSAKHIHFHEFVERNRRLYGASDEDIFAAWQEAVRRARR